MMRLPVLEAIGTTFCWPFTLAHLARAAAAMRARPAAVILGRGPAADPTPLLFNPLSALIAVSRAFTCCAALSRSAFNCTSMSMCSSPGEDCSRYKQKLCGSLHQREQHSHSIVKFLVFLRSESLSSVYSVLMMRPTL